MPGDPLPTSPEPPEPPEAPQDFESSYVQGVPPWDIGRPQAAFARLAESGGFMGRVLDVGCGTGEHALLAAALGHQVVGVDLAATAVGRAQAKAAERGLEVRFQVGDALGLQELGERFDTVVDCGLFHVFPDAERARYVESLAAAVVPGGRYYMLCFSEHQPGDWGPRRVTQEEIRASLADGWVVESIEPAVLEVTIDPEGVRAWLVTATRT